MNTLEEIFKKTIIDFDTYFHLLRHFHKIDEKFLNKFVDQTLYEKNDIEQQMYKPGSKFRFSFAKNPEDLIKNLAIEVDYKSFYVSTEDNKTEIAIEFDHEIFPKGIGFDGIAAIRNLVEEERNSIEKIERNGYIIKTIIANKKQTWKLNLYLIEDNGKYLISTFFPGIYTPPYPNGEIHSEEQLKEYSKFWNEHVIISS